MVPKADIPIRPLTSQPTSIRRLPKVSATLDQWIFTFSANCMVNKAYAAKALKEMHERREIEGRVSGAVSTQPLHGSTRDLINYRLKILGKQTVYHTIQDPADDASPESLAAIDKELEGLREEIAGGKTREKALKAELATLNSRVSTADLRQGVLKLEAEKGEMSVRLSAMCNRAVQPVSVEEKARVDKEWKVWKRHMNVRKRICRDLWDRCTEVLPEDTTKEDLWVR